MSHKEAASELVHGLDIPAKGEKVSFINLGKEKSVTGDGKHSCYQLAKHHTCDCCKPKKAKIVKKAAKKPAAKKGD